jgi:hypothetical protein
MDVFWRSLRHVASEFLRAELLGEARDCWRAFFASVDRADLPIQWHLADKAREFEAQAANIIS